MIQVSPCPNIEDPSNVALKAWTHAIQNPGLCMAICYLGEGILHMHVHDF